MSSHVDEKEEILVLYASQTGNSEQAAIDVSEQIPERLGADRFSSRHMQLDDFLELERAPWTRVVVIVTSSYGVGGAPLGGYRFRALCDHVLDHPDECANLLKGVSYALLGLGDSGYTTFFENPTTFDRALRAAGAVRFGALGKADAAGEGEAEQSRVVQRWKDSLWEPLREVARSGAPLAAGRAAEMRTATTTLTDRLLGKEEDETTSSTSTRDRAFAYTLGALVMALIAIVARLATK